MEIVRSVVIDRPIDEVFAFVADPRNDPRWCSKLVSVEQVEGDATGPGGRWRVVHRPVPLRPAREMRYECVSWDPPRRIEWREDDGHDVIDVVYELEPAGTSTRFAQRDDARLGAPRLVQPIMKAGIGRDIAHQLGELKRVLEHG
jgi:uncharacterized protein YndB with AHSA1/START domain